NRGASVYRQCGGRVVRCSFECEPGVATCRITVSDEGPGLAPEARAHLYEPFRPWGSGRGSGLGLAIAREIVARHEGALRIEEGPGCRVVVELPAHGPAGEPRWSACSSWRPTTASLSRSRGASAG